MTKRDLVIRISNETEIVQLDVGKVVQSFFDTIGSALAKGQRVELRNFGAFDIKLHKGRVGRNPRIPELNFRIPARTVVKFKAGKVVRKDVAMLLPES